MKTKQEKNNRLLKACEEGDLSSAKQAVVDGANINCKNREDERTPAMLAIYNNHDELADWLISQESVDVNSGKTYYYETTLHIACGWSKSEEIVSKVAGKTVNVNAKDKEGNTPVQLAVLQGNVCGVLGLMSITGIDWQVKDTDGDLLIDLAR